VLLNKEAVSTLSHSPPQNIHLSDIGFLILKTLFFFFQTDTVENLIGFNMVSYRSCKNMWKSCVEHHTFFRLHTPNPPQKKMFSLGSRFRYR